MASRQKAKIKSPNFINALLNRSRKISLTKLVGWFRTALNKICPWLQNLRNYLIQHKSFVSVLLLLFVLSLVTVAAIVPGTHKFEGNLIFEEMSFISNDQQPKPFLQNIRGIKALENEGIQTLTFTGSFQSQLLPQLNQLNFLKIQLTERDSKLIIAPANGKVASEITLNKLQLQPQTKINGLNYDFYRQQLNFFLQPNPQANSNILNIDLGQQPIKVTLEGYKLPDVKLPNQWDE